VRSGDDLAIDVGMACWLSLAASQTGVHLPAGFESVLDRAGHEASGIWGRAQDLARRLTVGGGGETATAVASGGAGRAVGVCATGAAIVCLAGAGTGLVGPGIVGLGSGGHPEPSAPAPKVRHHEEHRTSRPGPRSASVTLSTLARSEPELTEPSTVGATETTSSPTAHGTGPKKKEPDRSPPPAEAKASVHHEEVTQVEEEVSGIARASQESSSPAPPVAAASDETTEAPTVVHKASGGGTRATNSAEEEFNFER
jgi:hypothetical protein